MNETLAEDILEYVRKMDYVSFPELLRHMEGRHEVKGKFSIIMEADENLVLWYGLSENMCEVLHDLRRGGLIKYQPSSLLVYMIDGGMLTLPLAQRPPKVGYKEPHWLPVTIRPTTNLGSMKDAVPEG